MNNVRNSHSVGDGLANMFRNITRGRRINRGAAFGLIIVTALVAFEYLQLQHHAVCSGRCIRRSQIRRSALGDYFGNCVLRH